jgi:hypothetical protein
MADRGPDGKFIKGHKASVGNRGGRPRRATEEKYLKALSDSVSIDDWKAIATKAIAQAKDGDKDARAWLGNYLIGKPTEYQVIDADLESETIGGLLADIRAALSDEDEQ